MEDGRILKQQLKVSSQIDKYFGANNARLNLTPRPPQGGAWAAKTADTEQYLTVDFGRNMRVIEIATGASAAWQKMIEGRISYIEDMIMIYFFDGVLT